MFGIWSRDRTFPGFKVFFGYDYMMGVHSMDDLSSLQDELLHLDMYLDG